ncbi:MFS transporter [Pseudomonas simiae]|jgi:CP family cyanate transporter-like MFS transporter|uniref:MFS transporter n=1 Tax=Pseudomonas simiae TaxID=321846 RepID=U1TH30_9PSED|nr:MULTISPECIES: MFS transporter [Pseudomonas]AIB35966.1 MFS transporter [Pseudomonas simiae]ERH57776.1 MFS transporter [Pseudomonas simiae]QQD29481.1 MFS transporter [Pseudomonas simiae]WLI03199.1 MFS transporter [Pseudomonas simiae]
MTSSDKHSLAAVIGLLVLSIALRPAIVSIGPILLLIQNHYGLSFTQAALLTSIPDVCMGVLALLAPGLSRRFGSHRCMIAALLLIGVACLLRAVSPNAAFLLLTTFVISVGIAIAGALMGGWIKTHFAHRPAFFMGIYAAGLSVGATLSALFTAPITELTHSWRVGAGLWSLLSVTAVISWVWMARRFTAGAPRLAPPPAQSIRLPWRTPQAWLVALYFGASQFVVYALFSWLAPASTETAVTHLSAGTLLGLFTAVFAVASVGAGLIRGKAHDRRGLLAACTLIALLGTAGMAFAPMAWPTLYVLLVAIGLGMSFTVGMTLPLDNASSPAQAGAWTVFMLFIGYLVAALGPLCFGTLRDHTGNYSLAYDMLFAVLVFMLCLTPVLKPARTDAPAPQAAEAVRT